MTAPPPHPSAGLVARALLWCVLALAAAAAVWWPWSQGRLSLQTDLLALLPSDSRNPTAEQALDTLAARTSARALFRVGAPTREQAGQAATGFAEALRQHAVWAEVRDRATDMDPQQLLGFYAGHRFALMTASDREALRTGSLPITDRLLAKMHTPMAWSPRLPLAQDPLGLTDAWLAGLPLSAGKLRAIDGQLVTTDGSAQWVLVQATLQGSPWAEDVQQAAVDAVNDAGDWLRAAHPAAQSLHTGPVFHAEASRRTAQHEAQVLGAIATAATLLIVYVLLRSMRPVALSALCIGFGVLVAVAVTVHTQGHIHLITLVFGVSLIGEAADYAAQYLAAHLGAGPEWDPWIGLRQVAPGLLTALGTSALAYTGLWMTPLPALSQIGLFALAGLVAACVSVFLLLPALLRHPSKRPPQRLIAATQKGLSVWEALLHRWRVTCVVLCIAVAAPGWLRLQASDSLSQLATLTPERLQAERTLQTLTGLNPSGQFLLVQAPSPEQVLVLEEQLAPRLEKLQREGAMQSHQRLSAFVPSLATQQLNAATWATRLWAPEHTLEKVFNDAGLHPEVARQLHADWHRTQNQPLRLDDWLAQPWAEPMRPLWLGATPHGYASVILPMGLADKAALRATVQGIPGIQMVDKPGNIEALLAEARRSAAQWLVGAVVVLWGLLALRYRPQRAALLMLPALLGAGLALGTFGWLAMPVTLPTLMALMLVLGVGVNYPVFLWEGSVHSAAALLGVLISASTTLLSFGLLVFSSMPALQQFGLTLLIGTLTTMTLTPLGTRRTAHEEMT